MRLKFASPKARLAGPGAIVAVRCVGPAGGRCEGTVSLRVAGVEHAVAFSVASWRRQRLVVPLGAERGRGGERRIQATARTTQPLGSCREARRLLRLE